MTRLIFMGTPDFSATVLSGLLDDGNYDIPAVVARPDRAVRRKKETKMAPAKEVALMYSLPVYQPEKMSGSGEMAELMTLGADGVVTAAFGQFLPTKLLDSVNFAVNIHASFPPKCRGGAPIHYTIISGEEEAGVTIMEMVKKMDAGDMIAKASTPVTDDDNVGAMLEKLIVIGRDLLLGTLPDYITGNIKPKPQDESKATFSPNITPEEERIGWNRSTRDVFDHIHGLYPWPVAHTLLDGKRFKIYEMTLAESHGRPDEIIEKGKRSFVVVTGDGAISLKTVQPTGKPRMGVVGLLNGIGRKLEVGDLISE